MGIYLWLSLVEECPREHQIPNTSRLPLSGPKKPLSRGAPWGGKGPAFQRPSTTAAGELRRLEGLGWASAGSAAEVTQGSKQERVVALITVAASHVEAVCGFEVFFWM